MEEKSKKPHSKYRIKLMGWQKIPAVEVTKIEKYGKTFEKREYYIKSLGIVNGYPKGDHENMLEYARGMWQEHFVGELKVMEVYLDDKLIEINGKTATRNFEMNQFKDLNKKDKEKHLMSKI
jgi:hypothetical protein